MSGVTVSESAPPRWFERPWTYALLALVPALFRIWAQSPWYDELITLSRARQGLLLGIEKSFHELHLPSYPALVWATSLGGHSVIGARLASSLSFVLGAPLMFMIAQRLADRRHAIASTALYCFSPLLIWHAQDARHYAQLVFAALAAFAALLALLDEGGKRPSIALVAAVALGLLTHVFFIAFLCALGLHALIAWRTGNRHARRAAIIVCVTGLAMMPVIAAFYLASANHTSGYQKPLGVATLGYPAMTFAVGYSFGPTVREMHYGAMAAMKPYLPMVVPVILVFWSPIVAAFVRVARTDRTKALVLATYLVVPLFFPFALAITLSKGTFNVRYALPALIATLTLAGAAITEGPKWARIASAVAMGGVQLLGLGCYYFDERHYKEEFDRAAAFVNERMVDDDVVAMAPIPFVFQCMLDEHGVENLTLERVTSPREDVRSFYVLTRPWYADPDGAIQRAIEADPHVVHVEHFRGIDVWVREPFEDHSRGRP